MAANKIVQCNHGSLRKRGVHASNVFRNVVTKWELQSYCLYLDSLRHDPKISGKRSKGRAGGKQKSGVSAKLEPKTAEETTYALNQTFTALGSCKQDNLSYI